MSGHTKGPWKALEGPYGMQIHADNDSGFNPWIANMKCESCPAQEEANARLIAAAPDMLEALENIENDDEHMPLSAWKLIQDAIAAAKGES